MSIKINGKSHSFSNDFKRFDEFVDFLFNNAKMFEFPESL